MHLDLFTTAVGGSTPKRLGIMPFMVAFASLPPMSLYHTVYLLSLLARLFQTPLPYPHSTEVESPCQPNACRDTFLRENTGA